MKLLSDFYQHVDILQFSKDLLGKYIFTDFNNCLTGGVVVETEAYVGTTDRACHAYGGKITPRTSTMYKNGGICYVYLCYGIHHLFNIVTNNEGIPHVCLLRAIEPTHGIDIMLERRGKLKIDKTITSGPGSLTQALGIKTNHNGYSLNGEHIWLEDRGLVVSADQVVTGPRIGVGYAGEDALLPYRFYVKNNPYVSKSK